MLPPDTVSLSLRVKRDNFVTLLYTNCLDQKVIPPPAIEYIWHEQIGVLVPIWSIGLALPKTEEVCVENRDIWMEPLNVSGKFNNLEDLVSEQLPNKSEESAYPESEMDEEESDFEF